MDLLKKIIATLIFILPMLLAFIFTNSFLFSHMFVPTSSMVPTISVGSHLVVFKTYYLFNEPQRGDLVAFLPPDDPVLNADVDIQNAYLTKRIIGIGGDTLELRDGDLYINQERREEPYVKEDSFQNFGPVTVPDNHLLFLGDNRNYSYDSTNWENPFVPESKLRGKVLAHFLVKDMFSSGKNVAVSALAFSVFFLVYFLINALFLFALKKLAEANAFFSDIQENINEISYAFLLLILAFIFYFKDQMGRILW